MHSAPPSDSSQPQPAGLYIHIPFCVSKCPYCSFSSLPADGEDLPAYLDAVLGQARAMAAHPWTQTVRFHSLYLGGGTPTVYPGADLARLIKSCLTLFPFTTSPEISIEANPNTVDQAQLETLRAAGVNRLSIGVQSFSDRLLTAIGRSHSAAQAQAAFSAARQTGFTNINLDLIFGLPGQTITDWRNSLNTAIGLEPEHLSLYELMVETATPFDALQRAGRLHLPDEDTVVAMAEVIPVQLNPAGYQRYEISNYARANQRCLQNIGYWRNGPYLGLGAGAVSSFSGVRVKTVEHPKLFRQLAQQDFAPFEEAECLPLAASFRETVVMGLRMVEGVSEQSLLARFGLTPAAYYGTTLTQLEQQSLIERQDGHLRLTVRGMAVANQVLSRLV